MKILHVSPSYYPAFKFGGPIMSIHILNKALVCKGEDVTVYTTDAGFNSTNDIQLGTEYILDGVKIVYFKSNKFLDFLNTTGYNFSINLTKALKKNINKFDIIHITAVWNYPSYITSFYCIKYKMPYIISPRGSLYPLTFNKKSWKKFPYYQIAAKKMIQMANAIHYTVEDEKRQTNENLGINNYSIIIPNGLDLQKFRNLYYKTKLIENYPHLKDKKIILFLSRINWIKGLDLLIKAYYKIIKERNNLHLLIVGDDDGDGYRKKVEEWVNNYGISSMVTFTGTLTDDDKLEAYAGSDLFVLPSYSENFGMVVVEAMACGLPVVISNKVGISKEIGEGKAGIITETTVESLYKGINVLLEDQYLRDELSINGRKFVTNNYDINKVADKMIEAYKNVLKSHKRV